MSNIRRMWGGMWLGLLFIGLGIIFYLDTIPEYKGKIFFPGVLILVGVLILIGAIIRHTAQGR
jgi:hypothetical protein